MQELTFLVPIGIKGVLNFSSKAWPPYKSKGSQAHVFEYVVRAFQVWLALHTVAIDMLTAIRSSLNHSRSQTNSAIVTTMWRPGFTVWTIICDNQEVKGWLLPGTRLLKTLSGHSFAVGEAEFTE